MIMIGAMDISYDSKFDHAFMAIILGEEESLNRLHKNLGSDKFHMSKLFDIKRQKEIISKIKFDGKNNIAFCIKFNRNIKKISNMKMIKRKKISLGKINRIRHYRLLSSTKEAIISFLIAHNYSIHDIYFQCDSDCRGFLRDVGLHYDDPGIAHQLSDVVAWANRRNIPLDGVIELDRVNETDEAVVKTLKR